MPDHFLLKKDGQIATLTFNWLEKRNALNETTLLELEGLLLQIRDDPETKVLIFTGTGNTFSAGADLSGSRTIADPQERQQYFAVVGQRRIRILTRLIPLLVNLEQITIAAINGYAVGGGWSLALACDFRIAVEEAEFWFPEVDLGVPLSAETTALLVAHVGPARAKDMIITCRRFKAAELVPLGLLNQVVPKDDLSVIVQALSHNLAAKNSHAVMASKATVNTLSRKQEILRADLLWTRE